MPVVEERAERASRNHHLPALVFDFGGPVLLTPFELVEELGPAAAAYQLLHGRGPMAPADHPDVDWADLMAGRITERTYWDHRAAEWGELGGGGESIREMIAHLFEPARPGLLRAGALQLMHDARVAGHRIGVLTNDLHAFHTDEWIAQMHVLDEVDVLVDGSIEGYLKPHPRLYEVMAERLDGLRRHALRGRPAGQHPGCAGAGHPMRGVRPAGPRGGVRRAAGAARPGRPGRHGVGRKPEPDRPQPPLASPP
ncbi:MAG: hypothetical protein R2731_00565 [Nocardioides sp.]